MEVSRPKAGGESAQSGADTRADLGILFVHGIGQSGSGDTLSRFGEPFVGWIHDWVKGAGESDVDVIDGVLGVEADDPKVPAQSRLKIRARAADGGAIETREWLIAESWWARSFVTPTFGQLANWGAKIVPWTVFYHFDRRFSRAEQAWDAAWSESPRKLHHVVPCAARVVWEWSLAMFALVLGPLLVAALLAILLVGLLPIPRLRKWVGAVQRRLALTVGDSYSLLGPKIGAAAIYGRVRRDLEWLLKRAKKVAVVAHSQGAAVAYRVVSQDTSGRCGLLFTFGAGIRKLGQIRRMQEVRGGWVWLTSVALIGFVIATVLARGAYGGWQGLLLVLLVPASWLLGGFVVGLVVGFMQLLLRIAKRPGKPSTPRKQERRHLYIGLVSILGGTAAVAFFLPGQSRTAVVIAALLISFSWGWLNSARTRAKALAGQAPAIFSLPGGRAMPAFEQPLPDAVRWVDMFARSDPVPNGPIPDRVDIDPVELRHKAHGIETIPGRNRDSVLSDHTTYWSNPEDFVAPLLGCLGDVDGLQLEEILPVDHERLVLARHRRRWRVGWVGRARLFVFATVLAVCIWGDTAAYAETLLGALADVVRAIPLLGSALGSILPDPMVANTFTEGLTVLFGTAVALGLLGVGRAAWEVKDRTILAQRLSFTVRAFPQPGALFHFLWMLIVGFGLVLILRWTDWVWWVYVLAACALFFLTPLFTTSRLHQGSVRDSWPRLLQSHGLWSDEAKATWERELRSGQAGFIDPLFLPDGSTVWQSGIALVRQRGNPRLTEWLHTGQTATLLGAGQWSKQHVERVYVALGDEAYRSIMDCVAGAGDAEQVVGFWSRFLMRPGLSAEQRYEAHTHRAYRLTELGRQQEASADYAAVIDLPGIPAPDTANARVGRGMCVRQLADPDAALEDFQAVIDMDGATAEARGAAYAQRAQIHQERQDFDLAHADFTVVTEMTGISESARGESYANRGWGSYLQGDFDALLADSEVAVKLAPDEPYIGYNLAFAYFIHGRNDAARQQYEEVLRGTPNADAIQAAITDLEEVGEYVPAPPDSGEFLALLREAARAQSEPASA